MKIIPLTPENEKLYFLCLEDWSPEMAESGCHKECWFGKKREKVRVKLATDDAGNIGGMIQYLPIEESFADGHGLYMILCIWVHGYKEGRGNFQKKGMGKALLKAAEEDAKQLGAKGLAAWGVSLPFWMRASWFKKHGYEVIDRMAIQVLLWKPFTGDAIPPKWIRPQKKPDLVPGKVIVSAFLNGWCPTQNITFERAKRAAAEFEGQVLFQKHDTSDRKTFIEWGISDALFVDGKEVRTGPPPSYEKVKRLINKRVRKL